MSTPALKSTDPLVVGVVLAAGSSTRAGCPKALARLAHGPAGETLVERAVNRLREAGAAEVVVVVAPPHESRIRAVLPGVPCVTNPTPELGMLSSLQAALGEPGKAALPENGDDTRAIVVSLVDHPRVTAASIGVLIETWQADPAPLVCPTYRGRRGHPFLLAGSALRDATALAPTQTLRDLQMMAPRRLDIEVDDPHVLEDLDTLELLEEAGAKPAP